MVDSSQVDFTNPENFYHDVNSVAGLLKQFFRDLPDPLFTSHFYTDFINAARKQLRSKLFDHELTTFMQASTMTSSAVTHFTRWSTTFQMLITLH